MKSFKIVFYLLFILLAFGSVNSIGVYNSQEYTIFTNNLNLTININITNPTGPIIVKDVNLSLNSQNYNYYLKIDDYIPFEPNQVINYKFKLKDFNLTQLKNNDKLSININAIDENGKKIQTLEGSEPTNFKIKVDTQKPQLSIANSFNDKIKLKTIDEQIHLDFNKRIKSYKLYNKDELISSFTGTSLFEKEYPQTINYILPKDTIIENNRTDIKLEFEDLSGNKNTKNYTLIIIGKKLKLNLLSRKDNSTLSYFYNSSLPQLFGKTIYSDSTTYNLRIETNTPSNCYYASNLFSFKEITDSHTRQIATSSQNNLLHEIPVNTQTSSKIWVACQKIVDPQDVVYLSEELFNKKDLINVKFYNGKLNIQNVIPSKIITNKIFDLYLDTTQNSLCSFEIDTKNKNKLNTTDLRKHFYLNEELQREGNHKLSLSCVDVLGDYTTLNKTFILNSSLGVKIISFSPHYFTSQNDILNFKISTPADCRYVPPNTQITTNESFFALTKAQGSNLDYSIRIPTKLKIGENILTFSCLKNDQLFNGEKIKILYDPNGPVLSNLKFKNGGVKSDFVSSYDEIEYDVDVNSLTPIRKFSITVFTKNGTLEFEKSSSNSKIKGDFKEANKIKIVATNANNKNSTAIEKAIKFDLEPPKISFTKGSKTLKINCIDIETQCRDVKFSFSSTAFTCNPSVKYDNEDLQISDNNYVCAQARDLVGHYAKEQMQLVVGFDNNNNDEFNTSNNNIDDNNDLNNNNGSNNDVTQEPNNQINNTTNDNYIDETPFNPQSYPEKQNSNATTYSIIAAVMTLLGSLGGGGFYAYKKGYLNKHLEKFGFGKKMSEGNSQGTLTNQNNLISKIDNKKFKKTSYNDHYKKLNSFLDKTIEGKSGVFKDFDKSNKGKVKGYDDTLIKQNKKTDISKEDFDDFYSSSKNSTSLKDSKSLEKQAEDFEEYHSKKKQNNKKKE